MSAPDQRTNTRVYSRENFLSLYLPAIVLGLGSGVASPAIPIFAKSFGVSFGTASLVFIVYLLGAMLATVPTGYLIDRIGRRKMVLAGPILLGISSLFVASANSFETLLLWRLVGGAAQQMWQLARLAMIADTGGDRQRGRQITGMVAMTSAGNLLGPAMGGFMAAAWDIRVPFVVHGILAIVAILPSFTMMRETAPTLVDQAGGAERRGTGHAAGFSWSGLIALCTFPILAFFLAQFLGSVTRGTLFGGTVNLYPVYAYGVGPEVLGLLGAVSSVVGIPITFASGALMDRFGRKVNTVPGFIILGTGLAFTAWTAHAQLPFSAFVVAFLWFHIGQSITSGNMQIIGSDIAPAQARGQFFGVWRLIGEIGQLVSPAAFAFLVEAYAYSVAFAFLSATAFATALVLAFLVKESLGRAPTIEAQPREAGASAGR
jgi:MFS family permease